jgi:hypothetical protein
MTAPFSTGKDRASVQPGAAGTVLTSNGPTLNPAYKVQANAPAPGATGTVLTSNGPSVAPTYQAVGVPAPATVIVSSADLLALPGVKPIIVPAPGAGKVVLILSLLVRYIFGTIPYTLGNADNQLSLVYNGGNVIVPPIFAASFLDQSANQIEITSFTQLDGIGDSGVAPEASIANSPIKLDLIGTTPALTLGDGTLEFLISSQIFTL